MGTPATLETPSEEGGGGGEGRGCGGDAGSLPKGALGVSKNSGVSPPFKNRLMSKWLTVDQYEDDKLGESLDCGGENGGLEVDANLGSTELCGGPEINQRLGKCLQKKRNRG